jgi:hypothetical protein
METSTIYIIIGLIVLVITVGIIVWYFTKNVEEFGGKSMDSDNTWDISFNPDTIEKEIAWKAFNAWYQDIDYKTLPTEQRDLAMYYLKRALIFRSYQNNMNSFWEMYPSRDMKPEDKTVIPEADNNLKEWSIHLDQIRQLIEKDNTISGSL